MLPLLLALSLAAAPARDTVTLRDGSRLVGTVIEESPKGVSVEMPDGTLRRFEPREVARIEFADGSTWPLDAQAQAPAAPQPAPAPPPQASAPARNVEGPLDTVFLVGGGRVRGRVLEEIPREGVTVQVPDGTVRRYASDQVARVEYGDGTVSRNRALYPPRPPPPRYTPPPRYLPPPPPSAPPPGPPPGPPPRVVAAGMPAISPVFASLGLGGAGAGGELERGVNVGDVMNAQADVLFEAAIRLTPEIALGGYLDVGVGDPSSAVRATCRTNGLDCTAESLRAGLLLRYTWNPAARTAPWIAVGTGYATTGITADHDSSDVLRYRGRDVVRLMAGVDLRTTPLFGFGLYGGISWTSFSRVEDATGSHSIQDQTFHTMGEGGIRLTLFP
jgi:hypothetical protein